MKDGHYHMSVRAGSKSKRHSASSKAGYICRIGAEAKHGDLGISGSGNMPAFAAADPAAFWNAADRFERANACVYKEIEVALPNALDQGASDALARALVKELAGDMPHTFAVHEKDGNRHLHLMVSERVDDGIERDAETYFKRANKKQPEQGGVQKRDALKREWLDEARFQVQRHINDALAKAGVDQRVDCRSHKDRGIKKKPGVHIGTSALAYEARTGKKSERRLRNEAALAANDVMKINPEVLASLKKDSENKPPRPR